MDRINGSSGLFWLMQKGAWLTGALGCLSVLLIGVIGVGKTHATKMTDFYWYFAGGRCFWLHSNMYDFECVRSQLKGLITYDPIAGLAYPPNFTSITIFISSFPLSFSVILFTFINLCALIYLGYFTITQAKSESVTPVGARSLHYAWVAVVVAGSAGLWGAMWLGQFTIILAPCLWAGFTALDKERPFLAGALLSVVSMKPQIALFVFFWLVLHCRFKALGIAGLLALLMATPTLLTATPEQTIRGWLHGITTYQNYAVNTLGNSSISGVPSLLANFGFAMPISIATFIGALVVLIMRFKLRSPPFAGITLATLVTLQFIVYSRAIDTILFAPAFALFWPNSGWKPFSIFMFLGAIILFCAPQSAAFPPLSVHYRTLFFLLMFATFFCAALRGNRRLSAFAGYPLGRQCSGRSSPQSR